MNMKRITRVVLIIFLSVFLGCSSNVETKVNENAKYVKVFEINKNTKAKSFIFNGSIKEQSTVPLSFRVGGPIEKLEVKVGDFVKKNQIIASIDKRDYRIQLSAKKAQYEQLKDEYSRYKQLFEDGKLAANNYEKMKSGYLMAKAAFENAQYQIRDTELRAPFTGYIYEKQAENYQTVGAGMPIVTMIDVSKLDVVIYVPENQINLLKKKPSVFVKIDNAHVDNLSANIVSIGKKTEKNGLYKVKLAINKISTNNILPGMTAEVKMVCTQESHADLQIPSTAIFNTEGKDCVWLYNPSSQTIRKKEVEVRNFASNAMITIKSGLSAGDVIVTAGVNTLSDGQKVKPIEKTSKSNVGKLL